MIRTNNILSNSVCPLNIIPKMAQNTEKVIMHCHTKHSMVCLIHHRQFELYTSERMDILFNERYIILNFSLAKYFIFEMFHTNRQVSSSGHNSETRDRTLYRHK